MGAIISILAKKNLKQSLDSFEHERDIYVWQKSLDDMVSAVVGGRIIKDKIYQVAQVGELKANVKKALNALNIAPKAQSIAIYQNIISR